MPFPVAAGVAAGATLLGSGMNMASQGSMNRKTRQWNEKMYDRQKQDNIDFWNMQNEYNSPQATMQRHIAAGINPNVPFGNGPVGQSGSAPDTPHAMPYTPRAPQLELGAVADTYFNIQSRAQQLSNEKQIGNNMVIQEALLKEDLTSKKLQNTFMADTYTSKVRGFLGDNEQKYNNAIKTFINRDLLEYLSNSSNTITPNGVRSVTHGEPSDSLLVKDWLQDFRSKQLGNTLRGTAIEGNRIRNKIENRVEQFGQGDWSKMSPADIVKMLMQGLILIKR